MSLLRKIFNMVLHIIIAHYVTKLIFKDIRHFGFILFNIRIFFLENNIYKILLKKKSIYIDICFYSTI